MNPLLVGSAVNALKGGTSSSGGVSNGYNSAAGSSQSYSQTDAQAARDWSAQQAEIAFNRNKELQKMAQDFNAKEAQKARDFNEQMANTIYTRSVKNMIEAGINPILAANMGLSGASVNSGASASVGANSAPMAQSFMDTSSASSSSNTSYGENHGSNWGSSENGIATGLGLLGQAISGAIEKIGSSQKIDIAFNGLKDIFGEKNADKAYEKTADVIADVTGANKNTINDLMMTKKSNKYKSITKSLKNNNPALYNPSYKLINQQ